MSLCRSARIRAPEAAAIAGDCPSRSAVDDPDGLWCCCGGVDDGRLMLCCDKQCEGCCVWYHFDCLGLSYPDAVRIGASQDDFFCPHCSGYNMTNGEQCASETTSGPAPVYAPYTDFQWGDVHGELVCNFMLSAYEKVVHWKPNVFLIPFGKAGKRFVKELARLYQCFAENSALHSIALLAVSVMQPLLLQKPYKNSKAKDRSSHLIRRLDLWCKGSFDDLLREGQCIQDRLRQNNSLGGKLRDRSRLFDHLMSEGKVSMALRLLSEDSKGGLLSLDSMIPCGVDPSGNPVYRTARDILLEKHPSAKFATPDVLLDPTGDPITPQFDPIIFDSLTGDLIKRAALNTHGAAGLSGVDAYGWKRLCTSFNEASVELCQALASVARCLSITTVEPAILMPFVACRLIPLDKRPGVRPIGIGDVPRRIVAKAILYVIGDDIALAAGPLQTCVGQSAGSEAAVHAMKNMFDDSDCEAALLVDATNAFNCVNRQAALHNISILCPAFSTILNNTYAQPVRLFVVGEGEIPSCEGTTQGDPLAMAMYALAVVPLIKRLRVAVPSVGQVWFADDATAVGKLKLLHKWWQILSSLGPNFGYFSNASKTVLIVKPHLLTIAKSIFADTGMQITDQGQRHLGAALGSREFAEGFVAKKVCSWSSEVLALAEIATNRPHAAFCAFTHGMIGRWVYIMRTIPNVGPLFQPLEDAIRLKLIPALTGHGACSALERDVLSLPCRLGGLGIVNPVDIADSQFTANN